MRARLRNPDPYTPSGAYRLSPRFQRFEQAKEYILSRPYLLKNDPAVAAVEKHFWDMFNGPRSDLYGREERTYSTPVSRYDTSGTKRVVIADWEAMAGINRIADLAEIRARAFENVVEAYLLYVTALTKLAGPPAGPAVEVSADAPKLPAGLAWLPVEREVFAARDMMKAAAGAQGFGIDAKLHPDFYNDYIETVESYADVSLEDRGAWDYFGGPYMLTTWTEVEGGKPVRRVAVTTKTADMFGDEFVRFDVKVKTEGAAAVNQYLRDRRDQRRQFKKILAKEPGLKKKRGGAAGAPSEAAMGVYRAGLQAFGITPQSIMAPKPPVQAAIPSGGLDDDDLSSAIAAFQTSRGGGPAPVPVRAAPVAEPTAAADISADLDELMKSLNNNPKRYRHGR